MWYEINSKIMNGQLGNEVALASNEMKYEMALARNEMKYEMTS